MSKLMPLPFARSRPRPGAPRRRAWTRLALCIVLLAFGLTSTWAGEIRTAPEDREAGSGEPAETERLCAGSTTRDAALTAQLDRVLEDTGLTGAVADGRLAVGLALLPEQAPARFAMRNGHRMLYAASLPKIAILLGAAVAIERGRIEPTPDLERDMQEMIRRSCNACSNRVLDRIGGVWLLDLLRSPRYRLYDPDAGGGLWVGKPYGSQPAFRRDPIAGLSHAATVFQVLRFYCGLERGTLAGPAANDRMRSALVDPGISHKFVRGLQERPPGRMLRKSGTWRSFHSDSVLVEDEAHRYVLVALADDPEAGGWLERLATPLAQLARRASDPDSAPGAE